jgi:DNA-directed RNA polymerase specialized sigma24 family protein
MARIEWVRYRLENWARWCAQQDSSGLGYPKQTAFARLGGKGSRSETTVPTDNLEASETNDAVNSLKTGNSELFKALTLHYARALPRHTVAKLLAVSDRTVTEYLDRADHSLARWFQDRQALRAKMKETYDKGVLRGS